MQVLICADQLHQRIPGGTGVYLRSTLRAAKTLSATNEGPSWILYGSRPRLNSEDEIASMGFQYRYSHFTNPLAQRLWDLGLERPSGRYHHYHSFSMGGPKPLPRDREATTQSFAVYDALWESQGDMYPSSGRKWHRRRFAQIRDQADKIITISNESKKVLVSMGVESERLEVIYPGSDHLPSADLEAGNRILNEFGVEGDFLISVSTLEPRKNLKRVMTAFSTTLGELGGPMSLVIVGPNGWGGSLAPARNVFLVGQVTTGALSALYQKAVAMVYAPLEEGFGLPVLEANAACLPVISSRIPSANYNNTLVVDPRSEVSIAEGLRRVVVDDKLRSSLVTQGLMAANDLTWAETYKAHQRLFVKVATAR